MLRALSNGCTGLPRGLHSRPASAAGPSRSTAHGRRPLGRLPAERRCRNRCRLLRGSRLLRLAAASLLALGHVRSPTRCARRVRAPPRSGLRKRLRRWRRGGRVGLRWIVDVLGPEVEQPARAGFPRPQLGQRDRSDPSARRFEAREQIRRLGAALPAQILQRVRGYRACRAAVAFGDLEQDAPAVPAWPRGDLRRFRVSQGLYSAFIGRSRHALKPLIRPEGAQCPSSGKSPDLRSRRRASTNVPLRKRRFPSFSLQPCCLARAQDMAARRSHYIGVLQATRKSAFASRTLPPSR